LHVDFLLGAKRNDFRLLNDILSNVRLKITPRLLISLAILVID